jgi:predicted transcriptional regulator of viral defense system
MTDRDKVLKIIRRAGMVRLRELSQQGFHPEHLRRLLERGLIVRAARGVYVSADAEPTGNHSLAQAAKQVPHGVICLLSALRFHEIGTQDPFQVWMAVDRRARKPQVRAPLLRVVRFSGSSLTEGVEQHKIEGVSVCVYNAAKTVADCFKYRNKLGLDVAIEALRDGLRARRFTRDELWLYAKICRVANVVRPYLEATA